MSILLNPAGTNHLRVLQAANYNAAYVLGGYVFFNTLGAQMNIAGLSADINNFDMLFFDFAGGGSLGVQIAKAGVSTSNSAGAALAIKTWYYLLMARITATMLEYYLGTSPSSIALVGSLTTDVTGRTAATQTTVGAIVSGFSTVDGRVRSWRKFAETTTLLEKQKEATSLNFPVKYSAQNRGSTWGSWAMPFSGSALDQTGNGRDMFLVGGPPFSTTDGDPNMDPIPVQTPSRIHPLILAA